MTSWTLTANLQLVSETCCNCHVVFAMTDDLVARRRDDHGTFYCPNGHPQHYTGKSTAERLREQLDDAYGYANRVASERDAVERSARALRGHLTRQKRRAAAGVCPCCNRSFAALANHMTSKHPDYATDTADVAE